MALALTTNSRRANFFRTEIISGGLLGKYSIPINQRAAKKIEMSEKSVELIRKLCPRLNDSLPKITTCASKYGLLEHTAPISGHNH